jgi:hypothetical protein
MVLVEIRCSRSIGSALSFSVSILSTCPTGGEMDNHHNTQQSSETGRTQGGLFGHNSADHLILCSVALQPSPPCLGNRRNTICRCHRGLEVRSAHEKVVYSPTQARRPSRPGLARRTDTAFLSGWGGERRERIKRASVHDIQDPIL